MNKFVAQAIAYTEAYQKYANAPAALREAMCLKAQYPAILEPLRPRDVFAGCRSGGEYMVACVSPSLLDLNWNIPRILDAALRNGRQGSMRERTGLAISSSSKQFLI